MVTQKVRKKIKIEVVRPLFFILSSLCLQRILAMIQIKTFWASLFPKYVQVVGRLLVEWRGEFKSVILYGVNSYCLINWTKSRISFWPFQIFANNDY